MTYSRDQSAPFSILKISINSSIKLFFYSFTDVDFCDVEEVGGQFKVGETFQVEGEDECTCLPSGELECVPLCDEIGMPDVREDCRVEYDEGSCDYSIVCPVAGGKVRKLCLFYPCTTQP